MPNFARILYYLVTAMRRLYWDTDRLRKYQEKRLRAIVRYAYENAPFYHEKFRNARIYPSDITTLGDLAKLPVIEKDEIRRIPIYNLLSRDVSIETLKAHRTGGSTGKPFRFYFNNKEDDWRKAIYLRANISCGQKTRDHWAFITAPRHMRDTTGIQLRLNIYAQRCVSIFSNMSDQIRLIREIKPDVLDGYSGALFLLAREVERRGLETINPRLMFGSADLVDASQCKYMEQIFRAPYYDQFGCAELNRTAWQCPVKGGYHMDVDSVITQFVDEEGNDVSNGESGEIVYTSLFSYVMPFIRYSVGDIGKPSGETCSCGRVLPLMEVVEGRKDSLIILPDERVISPRTFTVAMSMLSYYENLAQFRIIQKKPDYFKFLIKEKTKSAEESLKKELVAHFTKTLSLSEGEVTFDVEFVDEIPLSRTGRLNAVVSECKVDG